MVQFTCLGEFSFKIEESAHSLHYCVHFAQLKAAHYRNQLKAESSFRSEAEECFVQRQSSATPEEEIGAIMYEGRLCGEECALTSKGEELTYFRRRFCFAAVAKGSQRDAAFCFALQAHCKLLCSP